MKLETQECAKCGGNNGEVAAEEDTTKWIFYCYDCNTITIITRKTIQEVLK